MKEERAIRGGGFPTASPPTSPPPSSPHFPPLVNKAQTSPSPRSSERSDGALQSAGIRIKLGGRTFV